MRQGRVFCNSVAAGIITEDKQGIKCWDKNIRRYVNSENTELYYLLAEHLKNPPRKS